jgi:ABC-type tungstate transport system permease subunit
MIITGDYHYSEWLDDKGLIKKRVPIWKERLILVGPTGRKTEMEGFDATEVMRRISDENALFFSLIMDNFVRASEDDLWKKASPVPVDTNKGYVETSRDGLGALLQAGDEGGFVLIGEGSFAQYVESERFVPALVKIADTEYFRTAYACLLTNAGFRKIRSRDAEKYLNWFQSEDAGQLISDFSIGGMNPFIPVGVSE